MEGTVKERTIQFIKYKGISMKSFEELCGLSTGYVTSMRKGYGSEKLNNVLIAFPDLNRDWLLYGEGEMLKSGIERFVKDGSGNEDIEIEHVRLLPLFAHGGSLSDFTVSVKDSDCEKVVSPVKGADFAIQVTGDSMAPEYPSGSVILIKKINESAFIEWGKAYVLDTENGSVVKKVVPSDKEGCIRCVSINPDPSFAPFDVPLSSVFGIYRVLMCMSMK